MRASHWLASLLLIATCSTAGAEPLEPIANRARLFYYDIYEVASRAVRLPYELAKPIIVRTALKTWVRGLPLERDVRKRILDRIDEPDLLDEVVPFLLALKDTYVADEESVASFDKFFRRTWSRTDQVPGIEHSMFSWRKPGKKKRTDTEKKDEQPTGAPELSPRVLDAEMTARIVTLYDALYLAGDPPEGSVQPETEGLESCERSESRDELRAAVERAQPIVREIVEELGPRLDLNEELDAFVQATLDDPKRLETVTTTGIEFIDHLVCSSYRVFANRIRREVELRRWMLRQLDEPNGGDLFRYLRFANDERRYAALVVVDGLQGHLIEALAQGQHDTPFLKAVQDQLHDTDRFAPANQSSSPTPSVQTRFLEMLATQDFQDPRYLPFFRDLYTDAGASDRRRPYGVAEVGVATSPTISVRNLPMVKTGATAGGPGGTGVPNFHFVDRTFQRPGEAPREASGRPYYFFGNDAMRLGSLTRDAGMRSLFDRLPRLGSFSCAAQYDDEAHYRIDALINLALGESTRDFSEALCMTELRKRARNEKRLRALRDELLQKEEALTRDIPIWRIASLFAQRDERKLARRAIRHIARLEQRTIPELLVYYNPWPDHFAHFKGPFGDEILAPSGELNRLDYWLGVLTRAYRKAGIEDRTLFAMAGDHGLAPVFHQLNPEVEIFDALRAEGVDLRVAKISSDEGEGPKLNNLFNPPAMRGYDVVVASTAGGNYMLDFFVDQESGWQRQPLYEELTALRQVSSSATIDAVQLVLSRLSESLDYLVVREATCSFDEGEVRVVGMRPTTRGVARADAWIARRGDRIFYRYENADLLDTNRLTHYETLSDGDRKRHAELRKRCIDDARGDSPESWCSETDWRLLTSYTTRPDSVVQLAHLYDIDRAGSMNLFPREGVGYNTRVPGRHAGEFFHEKDAFVGVWGPPVTRSDDAGRVRTAVNGSLAGTVYDYLTGTRPTQGEEGWGFPSLGQELFR